MNTMDEQELKEVVELANRFGWNGVDNPKSLSAFLCVKLEELDDIAKGRSMGDTPQCDGGAGVEPSVLPVSGTLRAQDVLDICKTLGLRYKVSTTTTASNTLIVEGQGRMTPERAVDWLQRGMPLYALQEIAGTTYRIALNVLLKQIGAL